MTDIDFRDIHQELSAERPDRKSTSLHLSASILKEFKDAIERAGEFFPNTKTPSSSRVMEQLMLKYIASVGSAKPGRRG